MVTLEMFASQADATETDRGSMPPQFQMYGKEQPFHTAWKSWYADPVTIVIERR